MGAHLFHVSDAGCDGGTVNLQLHHCRRYAIRHPTADPGGVITEKLRKDVTMAWQARVWKRKSLLTQNRTAARINQGQSVILAIPVTMRDEGHKADVAIWEQTAVQFHARFDARNNLGAVLIDHQMDRRRCGRVFFVIAPSRYQFRLEINRFELHVEPPRNQISIEPLKMRGTPKTAPGRLPDVTPSMICKSSA